MIAEVDGKPLMVSCRVCYRQYQLLSWAQEVEYRAKRLADKVSGGADPEPLSTLFNQLSATFNSEKPLAFQWPRLVCTYEGMEPNDNDLPF